jgi:mono/diheme cytochrome c family protein
MTRVPTRMACAIAFTLFADAGHAAGVNDGVYAAAQAERGRATYEAECARCHGATLAGGGGGPALSGPFWTAWEGRSVGELFNLTRKSMPADGPGRLSDPEYADIIAYMLSANRYPAGKAALPAEIGALKAIPITRRQ